MRVAGLGNLAWVLVAACAGTDGAAKQHGAGPSAPAASGASHDRGEPGAARVANEASACGALEEAAPGSTARARDVPAGARAFAEGEEHIAKGDYTSALEAYTRAIGADPELGLAYLGAVESHLYTDNDPQVMRALLVRAIQLLPANPRAHLRYADVVFDLGEHARAESHWRCALELRPDLVEARMRLGAYLFAEGRLEEAERELHQATSDAPNDVQARVQLANVLEAEKKPLEAAKEVEAAAKIAGRSASLYRRAGDLYETAGNLVAAKHVRAIADKLDPPKRDRKLRPLPKARGGG